MLVARSSNSELKDRWWPSSSVQIASAAAKGHTNLLPLKSSRKKRSLRYLVASRCIRARAPGLRELAQICRLPQDSPRYAHQSYLFRGRSVGDIGCFIINIMVNTIVGSCDQPGRNIARQRTLSSRTDILILLAYFLTIGP